MMPGKIKPSRQPKPEQNLRVRAVIDKAITDFKVKRWLDGSTAKADRVTLEELQACGYAVVKIQ